VVVIVFLLVSKLTIDKISISRDIVNMEIFFKEMIVNYTDFMHANHAPGHLDVHPEGFEPPPTHTKSAFSMLRVAALLSEELDRELVKAAGIGLNEVLVILQIMFSGGRLRMADLADTLVVTRGGVTKLVDRLVAAGYLDRVQSQDDRRVVFAEVTDAAQQLIHDHQHVVVAVTERRLGGLLSDAEIDQLHEFMHRLSCDNPGWEPPESVAEFDEQPA
jgi:DNA-binding MarR family transcriptional regulator